ncbi:MAG: hypothetical protein A3B86_01580 [Candidatus Yanofskybacteria bacterium RIFCSPHIGHO2_02_FULL_38_22b]|uniref:Uncharacterized protein n=1 Tax=Candidatus Yanofskybacteria bacterium RIFCSPHIGHO2_02_FULL_38_22b TaxID=1802673 RepID=A0A1F8F2R5_9BACT|nr:MAG: hypothetical protein A3B86_01580 [Candidatus Yanofskybacteria bacterium RIFCSPHIGHO2_02_FULL_38_22b]OGN19819.1 MAG: hypothetical protein A2910_02050 [Candidatus Yanofskybacteria bacterium RIFCSPLOWO2_01_FULL_39_28]
MSKNRLDNEGNFNNFRNFYEWLQLEGQQLKELIKTPQGQKIYQDIYQAECATMLEMMLPAHRRTTVVPQNKTGIAMCSCMDARRYSEMGAPVIFVCKEHQARFSLFDCYWEDGVGFFLEHYNQSNICPIPPNLTPPQKEWSDKDFLKDLGINPD